MPTTVTIHPTAKIALKTVLIAAFVGLGLVGIKRLISAKKPPEDLSHISQLAGKISAATELLLPVIHLPVTIDAPESEWISALSSVLQGESEVITDHGRIDVMTDRFVIEVDRLAKWHESIGQASHYAETTKKIPVSALIQSTMTEKDLSKLELIEQTCLSQRIKLILLLPEGS